MRRFTDDEDTIIVQDYAAYVPTDEIVAKIGRSEQTVRQRIRRLGLHRSSTITRRLPSAPDHLGRRVRELEPDEWIFAYDAWREEERRKAADDAAQADERAHALHAAQAAEIDSDDSPRNQKMSAMRALRLDNEEIAKHYGITRERVRQIMDPDYKASQRRRRKRGFRSLRVAEQGIFLLRPADIVRGRSRRASRFHHMPLKEAP
jgi:hypothetical protein